MVGIEGDEGETEVLAAQLLPTERVAGGCRYSSGILRPPTSPRLFLVASYFVKIKRSRMRLDNPI